MFTFLAHKIHRHAANDCRAFQCGLGHLSAYPFESHLSIMGKVSLALGTKCNTTLNVVIYLFVLIVL